MFLLLLSLAHAGDDVNLTEVLGWSGDRIVFKGTHLISYAPRGKQIQDASDYEEDTWALICVDPMHGVRRCWQDGNADHPVPSDMPLATAAEWATWKSAHPVSKGTVSTARLGKTLGMRLAGEDFGGWSENKASLHLGYDDEIQVWATLSKGDKSWEWDLGEQQGGGMYSRSVNLTPYWSANSKSIALLLNDPGGMHMRGPIPGELDTRIARTALVTLMAHESLDDSVARWAGRALAQELGLGFQRVEPAKKARDSHVVYYAEGWKSDADAIVSVLGGSAEPLSWKSSADLIVALGPQE